MASKKKGQVSQYCRIFQWIERQDERFAGAIRDLCMEGMLATGGRVPGVTFLYPEDKAFRDEIVEKTNGDHEQNAEAYKLVESLILPDLFADGGQFKLRAVGSRGGVTFKVESADATRVKLADGVELVPADSFNVAARREGNLPYAVWLLAKGRPPLAGDPYKAPPREKKKGGAKGRAAAYRGGNGGDVRGRVADQTEREFVACLQGRQLAMHNPYLARSVSLVNFLKSRAPETWATVAPVLDYSPLISFFLLVEPYKTSGAFLIPDDLIGAWNGTELYSDAVAEWEGHLAAAAALFRDRAGLTAQVDRTRQRLTGMTPRQVPQAVQAAYDELTSRGTVDGAAVALPAATRAALAGGKKLWQDEFRFRTAAALLSLHQDPQPAATFGSVVSDLRSLWPGNNYAAEVCLANPAAAADGGDVAPRTHLMMLSKFINSTDFLYFPTAPDAVGGPQGSMTDPRDWTIVNRNYIALVHLRATTGMKRPSGVSPQALQELQVYVQTHGELPPEIAALKK